MLKIYFVINRLNFLQISFCALSLHHASLWKKCLHLCVRTLLLYSHLAISFLDWTSPSPSAFLTCQYMSNFLVTLMALHWILSSFSLSHLNLGAKTEHCVPIVAQQSGVITLICWLYSSWCSPGLLLLLQRCASDTCWALLTRFGILSVTSWVLASSKQQTSQDSELGQQLVPQSPPEGCPCLQCSLLLLAGFDLLSRTSRSSWIPVELVCPCHLLPRFYICFSVDFLFLFFQMMGELLFLLPRVTSRQGTLSHKLLSSLCVFEFCSRSSYSIRTVRPQFLPM